MSKQNALNFLERWEKDKAFAASLQNAKSVEETKEILKKANMLFTKEEFREAYKQMHHKTLTDAELNQMIAAGKTEGKKFGAPKITFIE